MAFMHFLALLKLSIRIYDKFRYIIVYIFKNPSNIEIFVPHILYERVVNIELLIGTKRFITLAKTDGIVLFYLLFMALTTILVYDITQYWNIKMDIF